MRNWSNPNHDTCNSGARDRPGGWRAGRLSSSPVATVTTALRRRVQALEAQRRAERDALAWPELLAAWRAGQDTFDFAGGAAWRDMVAERRRQVIETLEDYGDESPGNPS